MTAKSISPSRSILTNIVDKSVQDCPAVSKCTVSGNLGVAIRSIGGRSCRNIDRKRLNSRTFKIADCQIGNKVEIEFWLAPEKIGGTNITANVLNLLVSSTVGTNIRCFTDKRKEV